MAEWILDIGPGDYELCRQALADMGASKSSSARVAAALHIGDNEVWSQVVEIWESNTAKHGEIAHITVYNDGTATIWPGSLAGYESMNPLPWLKSAS